MYDFELWFSQSMCPVVGFLGHMVAFLRREEYYGIFQNGCFSLPHCWKHGGFFFSIYCRSLVKLLEVNLAKLWRAHPTPSLQ